MDKGQIRAQEFTAQVRREIYIMRCLKHRHIVRMNEVLTSDTKLYIVMELVTGGELFDRIEKGRVNEDKARQYFQQLVDGVDFCHKKGVAHRDLKPENLLVDENGDIKITDFGFSSMKGMDVNTGLLYTQCGTPDYCAPEIIDSAQNGYTGAKVDAWSCGIILYALLCGRLPFLEPDTDKLYDLILACQVKYPAFISPAVRDLLENLLVRDPAKRFDLQKVKRHPWFLVNYEGDDAKLIKKRPFFNKNQKDLTSTASTPTSPMIPPPKDAQPTTSSLSSNNASTPVTHTPTYNQHHPSEHRASPAQSSSHLLTDLHHRNIEPSSMNYQHLSPSPSPSPPTPQPAHSQPQPAHSQPQLMDAGTPRNIHAGTTTSANRMRDDLYSAFRSTSPATNDPSMHGRVPTPPAQDVFTKVEDRPATPARRQTFASTAAAFQAAVNAAAMHANDNQLSSHAHAQTAYVSGPSMGNRLSPTHTSCVQPLSNGVPSSLDSSGFPSIPDGPTRNDDSSSEPDSVEDYENKPAPLLEMPPNPRQIFRCNKDGGRRQVQSLPVSQQPRQRSDLTGVYSGASHPLTTGNELASTSLSAIQRPRRGFGRDSANTGSVGEPRIPRLTPRSDTPSSPPVVYSPSPVNNTYERFRSVSPGFGTMRPTGNNLLEDGPNGTYGASVGTTHMPWQSSSSIGYGSSRDEMNGYPSSSLQCEVLARHLWNMMMKLRGSTEPASVKLSKELRKEYNMLAHEVKQLSKVEDIVQVFTNFLTIFETQALSDLPASSPVFGPSHSMDDEFDTNDGEHPHSNGEIRGPGMRQLGTDISSEEEPPSLSPVVAETNGPQISDLARRRNLSDLLSKWIKTTDARPEEGEEPSDSAQNFDLTELQRLMREHQSGREESNLAEDLLRLMNESDDGSNSNNTFGTGSNQPGQSPPPPHVQSTRSHDSYTQSRYLSSLSANAGMGRASNPVRSSSNNNTALPSDYVPGRFKEPNSMPSRGRNGNDRQTGLSGRTDVRPNGDEANVNNNVRERDTPSHMANSMGMYDVPYYMSDKKGGVANKLRGVLQTMKAKNHRLGEHHAQFRSRLPPDEILRLLARVLQDMGGKVTVKKETKRKMKCQLVLKPSCVLHAGIELVAMEDGYTCVAFRRSKADRGRTDTESFHNFFERVRNRFIDEANALYPSLRMTTANAASRRKRNNRDEVSRHMSDTGQTSLSGT